MEASKFRPDRSVALVEINTALNTRETDQYRDEASSGDRDGPFVTSSMALLSLSPMT
jgi:hypothetical protein